MISLQHPFRTLSVAAALMLGACAQVQETMDGAAQGLERLFGTAEAGPVAEAPETANILFQEGLSARAAGDEDAAFDRFLEAAKLGHGQAAYEVSQAYTEGRGTAKDLDAGTSWTNAAADMGEPRAQFVIGAAYYGGIGIDQDYDRAVQFLEDAAAQNHAEAQYLLGDAYSNGRGVPQDHAWAARWYGKAALQGLAEAQYALGLARISGLGLPPDTAAGYGWLVLAARGGHEKAAEVGRAIAQNLVPDAVKTAEAWAASFAPRAPEGFPDAPTVMYVQHTLNELGFAAGPVDGVAGPQTKGAVGRYRARAGLPDDGEVSPPLLERLRAEPMTSA